MPNTSTMIMYLRKFRLIWDSARQLKLKQAMCFAWKRLLRLPGQKYINHGMPVCRPNVCLQTPHSDLGVNDTVQGFCFLNLTRDFGLSVNWSSKDMPKLWRYNLHYFDYLQHPQRSVENKSHLITDWIEHNPQGTVDAW